MDVRHAVGAGQHLRGVARRRHAVGADIGAEIGGAAPAQREDGAVARAGDLQLAFGIAGVVGGDQVLAAVLDPFHRAVEPARRERDQEVLRIEFAAHAEAAADVGLDHGDGGLVEAHLLRQDAAVVERHLGDAGDRHVAFGRVPFGEQAARLHGHRGEALHLEALAAGVGRVPERCVGVAFDGRQRDDLDCGRWPRTARLLPVAGRGAVCDRRQRLDVERDQFERVLGQRLGVGDDDGDRLADVAHFVLGDDRLLERLELRQQLLPHGDDRESPALPISAAVMTACTPGSLAARRTRRSSGCGRARTELRRITACSASGLGTSSTNCPRPRRKRRSSRRSTGLPMKELTVRMARHGGDFCDKVQAMSALIRERQARGLRVSAVNPNASRSRRDASRRSSA